MIDISCAADPAVHARARAIALRCLDVIRACLREEEWMDALREFYLIAREEIERPTDGHSR